MRSPRPTWPKRCSIGRGGGGEREGPPSGAVHLRVEGSLQSHEEGPQGASGSVSSRLPSRGSLVPERVAQHAGGENPGKNERLRIAG